MTKGTPQQDSNLLFPEWIPSPTEDPSWVITIGKEDSVLALVFGERPLLCIITTVDISVSFHLLFNLLFRNICLIESSPPEFVPVQLLPIFLVYRKTPKEGRGSVYTDRKRDKGSTERVRSQSYKPPGWFHWLPVVDRDEVTLRTTVRKEDPRVLGVSTRYSPLDIHKS